MAAYDLAKPAPNPIAHHRSAERFLDAEAEAAHGQLVGAKEHGEVGT